MFFLKEDIKTNRRSILEMNSDEARKYFLKPENYFTLNLPSYINLEALINQADKILKESKLDDLIRNGSQKIKYSNFSNINYIIQTNKTVNTYRPITLIHPILYVDLVKNITEEKNWVVLVDRLKELIAHVSPSIKCTSLPFENCSTGKIDITKDKALHFWNSIEQESIKKSLVYSYLLKIDISNFYSSIYTHSIEWAVIGEDKAKDIRKNGQNINLSVEDKKLKDNIGSIIDKKIQRMNYGETVSIPQGNVVSDFIAEILLAYVDKDLYDSLKRIENFNQDYCILRYRDDYRIYTNSIDSLNLIKKELSVILQRFKLSLSEEKMVHCNDIVLDSISEDKQYWLEHDPVIKIIASDRLYNELNTDLIQDEPVSCVNKRYPINRIYKATIQKHLYIIKTFTTRYPNSGQLINALEEFKIRIESHKEDDFKVTGTDIKVLIAIVVDIIFHNPKITSIGVQLLSILLSKIRDSHTDSSKDRLELIKHIHKKLNNSLVNPYLDIWLQRILIAVIGNKNKEFSEYVESYYGETHDKLVTLINNKLLNKSVNISLFNEDWCNQKIDFCSIIDEKEIAKLKEVIGDDEIRFSNYSMI